jgi:hypothetical protein
MKMFLFFGVMMITYLNTTDLEKVVISLWEYRIFLPIFNSCKEPDIQHFTGCQTLVMRKHLFTQFEHQLIKAQIHLTSTPKFHSENWMGKQNTHKQIHH